MIGVGGFGTDYVAHADGLGLGFLVGFCGGLEGIWELDDLVIGDLLLSGRLFGRLGSSYPFFVRVIYIFVCIYY